MPDIVDLPTLIPSAGVFGLLAWLIVRLSMQSSADRRDYGAQIADLRQQHAANLAELSARHDAQMTDLRGQIQVLRDEITGLRTELEAERRARWQAEDTAAEWRRQAEQRHDQT